MVEFDGFAVDRLQVPHVDDYVHGALAASLETAQAEKDSGLSNDAWLECHSSLLAEFATFADYPTLIEKWSNDTLTERHIDFEFGLQRVLDGIERHIANRQQAVTCMVARGVLRARHDAKTIRIIARPAHQVVREGHMALGLAINVTTS